MRNTLGRRSQPGASRGIKLDAFESAGEWWLPDNPDDRVVGTLKYSADDGFRLSIPFGFVGGAGFDDVIVTASVQRPVVHGLLRDGRCATLLNSLRVDSTIHLPGAGREEIHASVGFVSRVEVAPNPEIDLVNVSYTHLRDWAVWHPASAKHQAVDGRPTGSADYHYESPPATVLADTIDWRIELVHTARLSSVSVEGFRVRHDCLLTIRPSHPMSFQSAQDDLLIPLKSFFVFCLDHGIDIGVFKFRLAGSENWVEVGTAQVLSTTKRDTIGEPWMLLSMPSIGDRMEDILVKWLRFEGDARRATSIATGLVANHVPHVDLGFLAAVQALEALARVGAPLTQLEEGEFRRRLELVRDSIEEGKTRRWACSKLKHVNFQPWGALVKRLCDDLDGYLESLAPATQVFLDDIQTNRNFYTHRDDRISGRVLEREELFLLTQGVLCLLKARILRLLGFSTEEIRSLMNDCQGTLQWRFRVAEQYEPGASA